ncbi:putative membrane protein [Bacteroides fragilis str. 3774 T13]|nr:putative membrane protein [Bacteroides fragilis str. 3774 T13]
MCFYFQLFSTFSVVLLFLGAFLFLICFLIPLFICTFVIGNNK